MKLFFIIALFCLKFAKGDEVKELNLSFDEFTVIQGEEPPKPEQPIKQKSESSSQESSKKSFVTNSIKNLLNTGVQKAQSVKNTLLTNTDNKPKKKKKKRKAEPNPAAKFPNPLFFDVIYENQPLFFAYSYIYEDKKNRDNRYIPELQNFNFTSELLKLAKARNERLDFYTLFNASKAKKNFDINHQDEKGNTMLLTALYYGNFEIFYFLVVQGADVNICNEYGVCPIQLGVYSNNDGVVEFLCNHKVDIMKVDKNGFSVFEYALYQRNYKISSTLLERYLEYPINKTQRNELIEFAKSTGMDDFAKTMIEAFKMNEKLQKH